MAPPRKTRGNLAVHRQGIACNHRRIEKSKTTADPATRRRKNLNGTKSKDEAIVEEWVYRFLGNLAAIEADKMGLKNRKPAIRFSKLKRSGKSKRKNNRRFRSPTPYSWDRVAPKSPPVEALRHPMDVDDSDNDNIQFLAKPQCLDLTRSAPANAKTKKASQDRSLLEKINGYIKAGIAEGKRRAKTYVRKALAFAMETGYLIPVDAEGKFLRVSPILVNQVKSVAIARLKKPQRSRGRKQTVKRKTTPAKKMEKRKPIARKSCAAEEAEVEAEVGDDDDNDDSIEEDKDDEGQESEREDDKANDNDELDMRSTSPRSHDRETSSEESRENPASNVSRSSSRTSNKCIEERPAVVTAAEMVSVRGRSADLDRTPSMICAGERVRPASANRLADLEVNYANGQRGLL